MLLSLVDRWYNILHILESTASISQNELRKKLNVSAQTLKQNINLLNKEIAGTAKIYIENGNYFLSVRNSENYEAILSGKLKKESDFNSVSKRGAFALKEIIESDSPILIDDLSEKLNVSRGTVVNDINKLREKIEPYDLEIIGKPNIGLQIEGKEYKIRLGYINIVLDYFTLEHVNGSLKKKILNMSRERGIPKQAINLLFKVIEITFIRIKKEHYINEEIKYYQNFLTLSAFFEDLIIFLEMEFNVTISNFEKEFLSYPLNIYNQGNEISKHYDFSLVRALFDKLITNIQEAFAINIDQESLFEEMKIHLLYLVNRLTMRVKSYNLSIAKTYSKYPLSYAISEVAGNIISEEIGVTISDIEISYLSLYFEMALNRKDKMTDKEIAIICHTGYGTSEIIKNQIQFVLGPSVKVTSYSENEIDEKILNEYFAVFSTIPLREKGIKAPVIQLNTVFDDVYVRQQWEKVKRTRIIDSDYIKINITKLDRNRSYKDNLNLMIDKLVDQNYVNEEFRKQIFEREKIKSTIFDKGIALPHAVNTEIDKLVLNIGQFRNSIYSSNEKVDLVFMIGIPENVPTEIENTLLDIYEFVFTIGQNKDLKEKILIIEDIDQFKEIIKKELMI